MTTEEQELRLAVGQLLIGGFSEDHTHQHFLQLATEGLVGGVILFRRNVSTMEQVRALTTSLTVLDTPEPLLVSVDQEGGRVQRLREPFPELPPMRTLGQLGRKDLVESAGRLLGQSLQSLGFHLTYAPVLDVDSNPLNPVIGDRAFSPDPSQVAELGCAFVEAVQSQGVATCGKHFPGHGDTDKDSHLELPRIRHDRAQMERTEFVPFKEAIRHNVAAIMTAHIVFEAFDNRHPATLSEKVIHPLLRNAFGYEGLVITDDMEMNAIADHYGIEEAAVRAVRAGCDLVLICQQPEKLARAHDALMSAVRSGSLDKERVFESRARVQQFKANYVVGRGTASAKPQFPHPDHAPLLAAIDEAKRQKQS